MLTVPALEEAIEKQLQELKGQIKEEQQENNQSR